jgi:hypothetical protein
VSKKLKQSGMQQEACVCWAASELKQQKWDTAGSQPEVEGPEAPERGRVLGAPSSSLSTPKRLCTAGFLLMGPLITRAVR